MVAGHVKKVSSKNNRSQLLFFGETGLKVNIAGHQKFNLVMFLKKIL